MFTSREIEKYADTLIWALKESRRGKFKKYDIILVRYDVSALPLVSVLANKLTEQKFNAVLKANQEENLSKDFYTLADDTQVKFVPAGEEEFARSLNGLISVRAPKSLTHLKNIPPAKLALAALARKPVRDIMDEREQKGEFGWTLCNYPTEIMAKHAGLSIKEYASQIKKACFLTAPDATKVWAETFKNINEVCKWLGSLNIKTINMQSKNTDLIVHIGEGRKFVGGGGCNIPSFEIFTSPDWRGTRGVFYADLPSYRNGTICRGVRLEFKEGRVVKSSAKQGESFVKKMLAMDKGAAQAGEFSLTDKRFSKIDKFMADTLFDENFGGKYGNSHIAVGQSFADVYTGNMKTFDAKKKESLGFNRSSLHWDLINTEDKTVKATLKNGKTLTIYEKGMFKI
ncbi:aminopeptidase [Parelusimicrobium proximum]|uniref:aminopeptidase n=1 Tax=Parelusimicrobium proximum TaxID=3228953 RepID=UPI003D169683